MITFSRADAGPSQFWATVSLLAAIRRQSASRRAALARWPVLILVSVSGTAAWSASPWDNPIITNGDLASDQIGWSVNGRRADLWKRDVPPPAPIAITTEHNRGRVGASHEGRRNLQGRRWNPNARLTRLLRPLATLTIGSDCSRVRTRKIVTIAVPLRDPLLLGSAPISLKLTYHLELQRGWINAQIRATANEVTESAIPGSAEGTGEMRLWLDPGVVLQTRGVTAHILLTLASRRPLFLHGSGGLACGGATFALDTLELDQG